MLLIGAAFSLWSQAVIAGAGTEQNFRGRVRMMNVEQSTVDPAASATSAPLANSTPLPSATSTMSLTPDSSTSSAPQATPSAPVVSEAPAEKPAEAPAAISSRPLNRTGDPCTQKDGMSEEALQQVGEFCAAAEAADEAAKNQKMLGGVHAGVAGLCMIPCVSNFAFGAGEITMGQVCSGASIAAAVGDVVVTKQFTGAVGALMGAYGLITSGGQGAAIAAGNAAKAGLSAGPPTAANSASIQSGNQAAKKGQKMSCMTAAVETGMSIMNFMGAKDSEKSAEENRKKAAELVDGALVTPEGVPGGTSPTVAGALAAVGGSVGSGNMESVAGGVSAHDGTRLRPLLDSSKVCSGGFASQLNCISAKGVPLPPAAKRGDFIPMLERSSRLPIDKLMGQGNAASIINSIAGEALGEQGKAQVQAAIAQAEGQARGVPSSTYASSGGGGGSSSESDPMASVGQALGDLMEGMNKKPEEGAAGSRAEQFSKTGGAGPYRSGIEEDRSISLFDRVSRRYLAARERLATLKFSSAENRALTR
jgi:hypothetical protein